MTRSPFRRSLAVASALIAGGFGPPTARAQFLDQPSSAFVVSPAAPVVTSAPVFSSTPVISSTRAMTRAERRAARRQGRYETLRPTYASGPGITFAPFSDRYYPRTIYSRDVPPQRTTISPR